MADGEKAAALDIELKSETVQPLLVVVVSNGTFTFRCQP